MLHHPQPHRRQGEELPGCTLESTSITMYVDHEGDRDPRYITAAVAYVAALLRLKECPALHAGSWKSRLQL